MGFSRFAVVHTQSSSWMAFIVTALSLCVCAIRRPLVGVAIIVFVFVVVVVSMAMILVIVCMPVGSMVGWPVSLWVGRFIHRTIDGVGGHYYISLARSHTRYTAESYLWLRDGQESVCVLLQSDHSCLWNTLHIHISLCPPCFTSSWGWWKLVVLKYPFYLNLYALLRI